MKKKIILSVSLGVLFVALCVGIGLNVKDSNTSNNTFTEKQFEKMTDKSMEVIDTSFFEDDKMESWFEKHRKEKGSYTYQKGKDTYILISAGKVKNENTYMMLNGIKEDKDNLLVSYETLTVDDVPNIKFKDDFRTTLVKVKGNYDKVEIAKIKTN